jgi:hypothetical protein
MEEVKPVRSYGILARPRGLRGGLLEILTRQQFNTEEVVKLLTTDILVELGMNLRYGKISTRTYLLLRVDHSSDKIIDIEDEIVAINKANNSVLKDLSDESVLRHLFGNADFFVHDLNTYVSTIGTEYIRRNPSQVTSLISNLGKLKKKLPDLAVHIEKIFLGSSGSSVEVSENASTEEVGSEW